MESAFIESINGKLQDECLSANRFLDLADARIQNEQWRWDYSGARPHHGLCNAMPESLAKAFVLTATSTDPPYMRPQVAGKIRPR